MFTFFLQLCILGMKDCFLLIKVLNKLTWGILVSMRLYTTEFFYFLTSALLWVLWIRYTPIHTHTYPIDQFTQQGSTCIVMGQQWTLAITSFGAHHKNSGIIHVVPSDSLNLINQPPLWLHWSFTRDPLYGVKRWGPPEFWWVLSYPSRQEISEIREDILFRDHNTCIRWFIS